MASRFYIVPVIGAGTHGDPRRPKYFADGTVTSTWSGMDYGFQPWMIVNSDLSASDDNLVVGQADAFAIPFDLAPTLNAGQVTAVKSKLEAINVPAGWVTTSLTWLLVLRTVLSMFSFFQRFVATYAADNNGVILNVFSGGVTLDSTFGSISLAVRNALTKTAQSFNLDTSGIASGTTMRVILKNVADQLNNAQYNFNGVLI